MAEEDATAQGGETGSEEVDAFDDLLENIDPSELSPQTWGALKKARRLNEQAKEKIRKQSRQDAFNELGVLESKKEGTRLAERGAFADHAQDFHKASGGMDPQGKTYSAAEWLHIFQTDPHEADRIAREGRVTLKHGKGIAGSGAGTFGGPGSAYNRR